MSWESVNGGPNCWISVKDVFTSVCFSNAVYVFEKTDDSGKTVFLRLGRNDSGRYYLVRSNESGDVLEGEKSRPVIPTMQVFEAVRVKLRSEDDFIRHILVAGSHCLQTEEGERYAREGLSLANMESRLIVVPDSKQ